MKALRQMGSGFFIGAFFLLLVIGGISLALTESSKRSSPPIPSPTPTTFAIEFASPLPPPTFPPAIIPTDTVMVIPSDTAIIPQPTQPATCAIPSNWIPITVGSNDDLNDIAQRYNTTTDELNQKNCLNFQNPAPGTVIYVPAVPTKVVIPCGPPTGWVKKHVVQPGENLFRIALSYGITYPQLQKGNCMGSSTTIFAGQVLWVPNVPTRTPTATIFLAPTNTATRTPDFSTPTTDFSTPTNTATRTPDFSTPTSSPVPTSTMAPTSTPITSTP